MCIRDRIITVGFLLADATKAAADANPDAKFAIIDSPSNACLLYTSDAADERSSVDLGGRRIIKKKKHSTTYNSIRELKTTKTEIERHQTHTEHVH